MRFQTYNKNKSTIEQPKETIGKKNPFIYVCVTCRSGYLTTEVLCLTQFNCVCISVIR